MKKILIGIILLFVGAFLYWTVSPLFINTQIEDALPEILIPPDEPTGVPTTDSTQNSPYPIIDTTAHPASGTVRVVQTTDGTVVRYENYDGTNGPDLYVYLAKDLDANDFVSLGRAKGNQGNINYTVPSDVDVSEYQYVMTWCRAFGVLFDYAEIN